MTLMKKRTIILAYTLVLVFVLFRVYLFIFPNTNLDIGAYNIHHLYTGLVLMTVSGLPLIMFQGDNKWLDLATVTFGAGLSMALDQLVYLIMTDGSDAAYLLPVSLLGALAAIGLSLIYIFLLVFLTRK